MGAFSVATSSIAAAALGCIGFFESSRLLGWPLWASGVVAGVAVIAGFVAFMPERQRARAKRNKPRRRRQQHASASEPAAPITEIPAVPSEPWPHSAETEIPKPPPVSATEIPPASGPWPRAAAPEILVVPPTAVTAAPLFSSLFEVFPELAAPAMSKPEPEIPPPPVEAAKPAKKRKPSPRRRTDASEAGKVVDLNAVRKRRAKAKDKPANG